MCQQHVGAIDWLMMMRGAPVEDFFVDGEGETGDSNVTHQPFLLQLHQLRNGLFDYLQHSSSRLDQQ